MAHHQLAHRHERQAQGPFCCFPRAGRRRATAADQGQRPATSARGRGLAHRRTQDVGREEILSRQPAGEVVRAALNRVELYDNDFGLLVAPAVNTVSARVSVADSVIDGSAGTGVQISVLAGATALSSLMITGSMISNNGNALVASGTNAHLRIGQTSVAGNTSTWQTVSGGLFQSYGDNYIAGNDVQPTPPVIARQ